MTTDQVPAGAAQAVPADPATRRERLKAALWRALQQWYDLDGDDVEPGNTKDGHLADAALAALPELAAADRLRARIAALVDEMTREAASYHTAHEHLAGNDHQASVSAHVRWQMATDAADRLRALLEET